MLISQGCTAPRHMQNRKETCDCSRLSLLQFTIWKTLAPLHRHVQRACRQLHAGQAAARRVGYCTQRRCEHHAHVYETGICTFSKCMHTAVSGRAHRCQLQGVQLSVGTAMVVSRHSVVITGAVCTDSIGAVCTVSTGAVCTVSSGAVCTVSTGAVCTVSTDAVCTKNGDTNYLVLARLLTMVLLTT